MVRRSAVSVFWMVGTWSGGKNFPTKIVTFQNMYFLLSIQVMRGTICRWQAFGYDFNNIIALVHEGCWKKQGQDYHRIMSA
jgi:hypothetical protein